jgi:hypothetical protein
VLVTDKFKPITREEVTDGSLVAGELRALRTEMRDWFLMLIGRLDRTDERIASLELHRTDANDRLTRHEHRIAAIEAAATKKEKP